MIKHSINLIFVLFLIPSALFAKAEIATFTLKYNQTTGSYSLPLLIGEDPTPYFLVLDTGSSNLNLIGSTPFCAQCSGIVNSQTISPSRSLASTGKTFTMHYGLGGGELESFQAKVAINSQISINNYEFSIYKQGKNLSNILGLAYSSLAQPLKSPLPPFFYRLNQQYDFNHQFTLQLCGFTGTSKIYLGLPPKYFETLPKVNVPILKKSFYSVGFFGISLANGTVISKPKDYDAAIIDSGTTGKILVPDAQLGPLLQYLRAKTSAKNKALPQSFWRGETCATKSEIDINAFPTLFFKFKDVGGKWLKLPMPSSSYITQSSCGKKLYKLAFVGHSAFIHHKNTPDHKKNLPSGVIILGTPFLERYPTTFSMENPAMLTFYQAHKVLCSRSFRK